MRDYAEFDVFLCYNRSDRLSVERIAGALEERGLKVFLDRREGAASRPWYEIVETGFKRCPSAVVVIGPSGMGSWQRRELDLALERQGQDASFGVIVALLPGAKRPSELRLLATAVDLRRGVDDAKSMDLLAAALGERGTSAVRERTRQATAQRRAERIRGRLRHLCLPWPPKSISDLDRLPTPLLVALGLIPAAALAWLAAGSPLATALLVVLIPAAAVWQGRRVRVVWEHGIPAEIEEPPPVRRRPSMPEPAEAPEEPLAESEEPVAPQPPYAVQDPLIELMALPGGAFPMGSDKALDPQAGDNELPRREVSVQPFSMARTPVTRGLYRSLMKEAPKEWKPDENDDDLPANYVSWEDAVRFCRALSEKSELTPCYSEAAGGWACDWDADGYRLPTEAEWEYACRAGTESPWFWEGDEKDAERYAWFAGNSGYEPHPVGEKEPNPWGLYDLTGNVWEWCWDWYADDYDPKDLDNPHGPARGERRVLRGGSFDHEPRLLRSAFRFWIDPEFRDVGFGFRCVRGSVRQLGH